MRELYQNQAASAMVFFASAGEHIAGVAGINSVTASASKDGAAFALITATASAERGRGWYNFTLNSGWTDTLGELAFTVSAASADPVDFKYWVTYPKFGASAALASAVSAVHATATYFPLLVSAVHATATQVTDKTGYSFDVSTLSAVTATQITDKTGYSILSTNLTGVTATLLSDPTFIGGQGMTATYIKASGTNTEVGTAGAGLTAVPTNWTEMAGNLFRTPVAYLRLVEISGTAADARAFNVYGTTTLSADDWAVDYGNLTSGTWNADSTGASKYVILDVTGASEIQTTDYIVALQGCTDGATWGEICRWNFKGTTNFSGYVKSDGSITYPHVGGVPPQAILQFATVATATYISDSTFLGAQGLTAVYAKASGSWTEASGAYKELTTGTYKLSTLATSAAVQTVSATATNILDHLAGTYTVDPTTSGASAYRMDGATLLKAWTLSAATYASAVPAFIKRTV